MKTRVNYNDMCKTLNGKECFQTLKIEVLRIPGQEEKREVLPAFSPIALSSV